MDFQLVAPHIHRQNSAELAISTFKSHFLSTLETCDPDYPIVKWDRLLQQSETTLNLLRSSRCNQKHTAYAYVEGNLDCSKTPLAPPGTKVAVHQKSSQQKSWDFHGHIGWYVGPAMNHYQCFRIFVPHTGREIISDTIRFLPKRYLSHMKQFKISSSEQSKTLNEY